MNEILKEDGTWWDLSRGDPVVTENVPGNIVNSSFPFHLKKIELSGLMIPIELSLSVQSAWNNIRSKAGKKFWAKFV